MRNPSFGRGRPGFWLWLAGLLPLAPGAWASLEPGALGELRAASPVLDAGVLPEPAGRPLPSGRPKGEVYFCALAHDGAALNGVLREFPFEAFDPGAAEASADEAVVPIHDDASVSDEARLKARDLVAEMLAQSPGELAGRLKRNKAFLVIIPRDKKLTDLPQFKSLKGVLLPDGRNWDDVRGIGFVSQPDGAIAVGVGEENLLKGEKVDGYPKGYLLAHELGHAVHVYGHEPAALGRIEGMYQARKDFGLGFASSYAATTVYEYFAVSSNVFFRLRLDDGREKEKSPEWLAREDPAFYRVLEAGYGRSRALWPDRTGLVLVSQEPRDEPWAGAR